MGKTRMPTEKEVAERNFSKRELAKMQSMWLRAEWDEEYGGPGPPKPSPPVRVKKKSSLQTGS